MKIFFSINGGQTYQQASEGVRIIVQQSKGDPGEREPDLNIHLTHEGIITDAVLGGEIVATDSQMYDDFWARLWGNEGSAP